MKMSRAKTIGALAAASAALSAVAATPQAFRDWPDGLDPKTIGRRVVAQFQSTDPEGYQAKGFTGGKYGGGEYVCYSVASLWVNALQFASVTGDAKLEESLVATARQFLPGGKKGDKVPKARHVDFNVFGAVPLEAAILTDRRDFLRMGMAYADDQWAPPRPDDLSNFPKWLVSHYVPVEKQNAYLKDGYSGQTRLWIDDMYMINLLQTQAYRATRDRRYVARAAKEMCLYLDRLQLGNGLFNHAPDVPFRWGRGNGWMAAGMPLVLRYLKPSDAEYGKILAGYRRMMATLLKLQRPSGLWGQLVDDPDPRSWDETSGSLMFAYAFVMGCKHGWLDAATYAPAARRAYLAVARSLDRYGNVPDVCCGTGAKSSREYYYDRTRINGDPHGQAPLLWCCVALLDYGNFDNAWEYPPEDCKLTDWQRTNPPCRMDKRLKLIEPVAQGEIRIVPTYVSCSVVWGSPELGDIALEYREKGASAWTVGERPIWFGDAANYRGSILRLSEDTDYELRLVSGGKAVASGAFRTWASDVPVAKTVVVDPATAKYPIVVSDQGSPDGWIRYTSKPGAKLGGKDLMSGIFRVTGARHVILEGMTLVGGGGNGSNPILIEDSTGVRVRNCELYGYGRVGRPDVGNCAGRFRASEDPARATAFIDWDAGVMIHPKSAEVTVERCYIHDPRNRSAAWYYSHPAGCQGIFVFRAAHSVVLRWNDIVGSDNHRWNDAIEGCDNFGAAGGYNRDADIYGNFAIFANDDNIELDGGQQNVRCFDNRFEAACSAVSIQGCCTSPSYVFDNLLGPCCDEFGNSHPAIKTSTFDPYWYAPYAGIWGNYMAEESFSPGKGLLSRYDIRGNTFSAGPVPDEVSAKYPVRDLPFILSTGLISGIRVSGQTAAPSSLTFTARATKPQRFAVRQNFDGDWYDVTPKSGTLPVGETTFTVTFRPERMAGRRNWRAAFLIRTPEGLSRCVSLYAERTDFAPPLRPVPPSDRTRYVDLPGGNAAEFSLDVKESGRYWLFAHVRSLAEVVRSTATASRLAYPDAMISIDGGKPQRVKFWAYADYPVWTLFRPGRSGRLGGASACSPVELAAGRHTVKIVPMDARQKYDLTGFAVSDDPIPFEPR